MIGFRNITKRFFGVPVLRDVSFAVPPGHTVGLVGENGAGKSTLMNILGGNLQPDAGSMLLDGRPYAPRTPRDAARSGVAFIHQELNLFPNLSIAENVFVAGFPRRARWLPLLDRRRIHDRTRELLAQVELSRPPETPVEHLSAGERQLVEIAKALALDARLILLDEPTTSLTDVEKALLFGIMARLRSRGLSMIYISHSLGHVLRLCDSVAVMRDGTLVAHQSAAALDTDRIVSWMVGREIRQLYPGRGDRTTGAVALEARGLSQSGTVSDISFELRRGEILGIAGLMGSGRSELARILFGLDPCAAGEIRLDGEPIHGLPPRERIRRGLAFLTEDRRAEGLCLEASIADNLSLVSWPRFATGPLGLLRRRDAGAAVTGMREAVRLTTSARDTQPVKTLSGGNQQKVVLGKWLLNRPGVLLLDEPTRGIDVGAKQEVYRLIADLARQGTAILMISSELEELTGLCDRILVMRRGRIRDAMAAQEFDRERILRAALHDETAA
ncbi:MAG: sugar ABC transporter ATP-binding protein [Verrucomicrobia bacterium]|nr:sugar ABC transporter ATP-binding protein [Verrucomicrobiota bacterium]